VNRKALPAEAERLYSAENIELKKQIVNSQKRNTKKTQLTKEKELEKCMKDKEALSNKIAEDNFRASEKSALNLLFEQLQLLTKENSQLKAEIKQLENQAAERPAD